MEIKKHHLVKKRNILNEMRTEDMALQELRFFSIYLSKINPNDEKTRLVRFSLSDFKKIMELKRLDKTDIEPSIEKLLQRIVKVPNDSGYGFTAFQLFKECKVDKDENGLYYVEIDAHDKALPLMFDFKSRYFTYKLWNTLRLKSANQLRMYEILKQYEFAGQRTIDLKELKSLLGFAPNEYTRWANFKTRVLDSCQKALMENTDIKFSYETLKAGKKVISIVFTVSKNENYADPLSLNEFIAEQTTEFGEVEDYEESKLASSQRHTDKLEDKENLAETATTPRMFDKSYYEAHSLKDYAYRIAKEAKQNGKVRGTAERYAYGILGAWDKKGYATASDLIEAGEVDSQTVNIIQYESLGNDLEDYTDF